MLASIPACRSNAKQDVQSINITRHCEVQPNDLGSCLLSHIIFR